MIETTVADKIIVGRVNPYIYAFSTQTVPNYLKVGDTYRGVSVRLNEWKRFYPNLRKEFSCEAMVDNNTIFRDYSVHTFLMNEKGRQRLKYGSIPNLPYYSKEFFKDATVTDLYEAIADIKKYAKIPGSKYQYYSSDYLPMVYTYDRVEKYEPRPNQQEAIDNFKRAIEKGRTNLLMYAVMRFGKSFTAMCCAKEMNAQFVVIVSAKADVKAEWKKTVESHIKFSDYIFSSIEDLKNDSQFITKKYKEKKKIVLFLTLQDLQGENIKYQHLQVFKNVVDLLIVDETHFGARAAAYGKVLQESQLSKSEIDHELELLSEGEYITDDDISTLKKIHAKIRLHLSGTPYRILMGNEFSKDDIISFCQFTDIVEEQEKWNREYILDDSGEYNEWDNPYFGFPQMIRFAFNPSKKARLKISELKKSGCTTAFSELFKPRSIIKKRNNDHKRFIHEDEILELFEVIDGIKQDDEILSFLDYDKIKEGQMCHHIVCVLPFRSSCDALEMLLIENKSKFKNLSEYEIINIAGQDSIKIYKTTIDVKNKISQCEREGRRTITLTVNRMLTGNTVEEWDTMLYLKNTSSPQEYDQSIFRLQNQYVKTYIDAKTQKKVKYNMKPQTLLVDFDPVRMFNLQELKSQFYNVNVEQNGNAKLRERIEKELEVSPIIVVNKNKLCEVTPKNIIDLVRQYSQNRSVLDETKDIPVDYDLLSNNDILDAIYRLSPIDSSKGLNFLPLDDEDGDDFVVDDTLKEKENVNDNQHSSSIKDSNNKDSLDKKLLTYYSLILFYSFLTKSKVTSLEEIIVSIDSDQDNKRICSHIGLNINVLKTIQSKMYPFILNKLDYKIQNINTLVNDVHLSPLQRARVAMQKFGRLSDSEIVTPESVAKKIVHILPVFPDLNERKFLDIASKQGEFACALYEKYGASIKCNIYAIPTSMVAYEFTYKIFELLDIPTENIFMKFTSYELLNNKEKYIKKLNLMKFDVVVGNPPYQLAGASGGSNDAPIYQEFADLATKISSQYVSLVIKSAWFTTGRENLLKNFRNRMLNSHMVKQLVVYPNSRLLFPDVEIKGGCCYYLEDQKYNGNCEYSLMKSDGKIETYTRKLDAFDILIRDPKVSAIVEKVTSKRLQEGTSTIDTIISSDTPFGIPSNPKTSKKNPYDVFETKTKEADVLLYHIQNLNRKVEYVRKSDIRKNQQDIEKYKVLMTGAGGSGNDKKILGMPICIPPHSVCSQSYLYAAFDTQQEALNFEKYLKTKFLRFLVSAIKITQSCPNKMYRFVPFLDMKNVWNDEELYMHYDLTPAEIELINNSIDIL